MNPVEVGQRLADRHAESTTVGSSDGQYDPLASLLNFAERPYRGDWTLRSALVRLAQPEPARVGSVLELVRRLDASLNHVKRNLERHVVTCDRDIGQANPDQESVQPYRDVRTADLGRLVAADQDPDRLMTGYQQRAPLDNEERLAVPLLAVAARFELLAETLTTWAAAGPESPPVDDVDRTLVEVRHTLDQLGVPEESDFRPRRGA